MRSRSYRKFTLLSPLSHKKAVKKLAEETEDTSLMAIFRKTRAVISWFRGAVYDDSFTITRSIRYNQIYIPVITGQFIPEGKKTKIEVVIRPHFVAIINIILLLMFFGLSLFIVLIGILAGEIPLLSLLIPTFPLLFLLLTIIIPFLFNRRYAREELESLFEVNKFVE